MSSYLNIYLVPKTKDKDNKDNKEKPLLFCSFSRNHPIYSAIVESINPVYGGNENKYTILTEESIKSAIDELDEEIDSMFKKIHEYELHANGNSECIEELINLKQIYKDMLSNSENLEFIRWFVSDINDNYTDFEKVLCNIT